MQDLVLAMVRKHQVIQLADLKLRMQEAHNVTHKQTENACIRMRHAGLLENRSANPIRVMLCTPSCTTVPHHATPDERAVLAERQKLQRRIDAAAAKAAEEADGPAGFGGTNGANRANGANGANGNGSIGMLCQPSNMPANIVNAIELLLLSLKPGEYIAANDVANQLGLPMEITGVRQTLAHLVYRATVLSRLDKETCRQQYRLTAERIACLTGGGKRKTGFEPEPWRPPVWEPPRALPPGWVEPPSLRDGVRVPYGGIKSKSMGIGMATERRK